MRYPFFIREKARTWAQSVTKVDFPLLLSRNADVAQLVARNLAKVQVAGSTPVVRSLLISSHHSSYDTGGVAERRGSGLQKIGRAHV